MNLETVLETVEMARTLAELDRSQDACEWYVQAVNLCAYEMDEVVMEAADYILRFGDYKVAYTLLIKAYELDYDRERVFGMIYGAFYEPNIKAMAKNYERNVRALRRYPYIFQKDFPAFEDLVLQFFPFDEWSYLPFSKEQGVFGELIWPNEEMVNRWFFQDSSKPLLLDEVYNGYHLTYLTDMVRKSEWYGGDNHIYLAYPDFDIFCGYLQVMDLSKALAEEKLVFLFGEERGLYPLDFKERYGIDYASMTPRPIGVREVQKVIFHIQTFTHTGGDFFNEVLDFHPNLLCMHSLMHDDLEEKYQWFREKFYSGGYFKDIGDGSEYFFSYDAEEEGNQINLFPMIMKKLQWVKHATKKDWLVAMHLATADIKGQQLDQRLSPCIFYQPHFGNQYTTVEQKDQYCQVTNNIYEAMKQDPVFNQFKYVKALAPVRRFTTSLGGAYRFGYNNIVLKSQSEGYSREVCYIMQGFGELLTNRNLYVDRGSPLFRDVVAIRFEDGKLNPRATFMALCAFLDIPWSDTLLETTVFGKHETYNVRGSVAKGFETHPVYNQYEEFLSDEDKCTVEMILQKQMAQYGYKPQFYDGQPFTPEEVVKRLEQPMRIQEKQLELLKFLGFPEESSEEIAPAEAIKIETVEVKPGSIELLGMKEAVEAANVAETIESVQKGLMLKFFGEVNEGLKICFNETLMISPEGHFLSPIPLLKPKEELLDQPLYE